MTSRCPDSGLQTLCNWDGLKQDCFRQQFLKRLIERTNLEIANLESQLHDAHDIDYVEFSQTQDSF